MNYGGVKPTTLSVPHTASSVSIDFNLIHWLQEQGVFYLIKTVPLRQELSTIINWYRSRVHVQQFSHIY